MFQSSIINLLLLLLLLPSVVQSQNTRYAVATIRSSTSTETSISGSVHFNQTGSGTSDVIVTWDILGLQDGEHGFHVHQFGDITSVSDVSTGYHFIPDTICDPCANASAPASCQDEYDICISDSYQGWPPAQNRHPGDMGNITSTTTLGDVKQTQGTRTLGQGKMSLNDTLRSIVGRAISVHANADDGSQPWGNAGSQVAWGVVGIANPTVSSSTGQTTNEAVSHPHISQIVCSFNNDQYALWGESVKGTVLIVEPEIGATAATLYAELTGLTSGTHSFHFHEFGDLRAIDTSSNPPNVGDVYTPDGNTMSLTSLTSTSGTTRIEMSLSATDLSLFAGRTLSIHAGATVDTNTISVAVCGINNAAITTPESLGFSTSSSSSSSSSSDLNGGEIFAVVFVVLIVLGAIGGFVYMHATHVNKRADLGTDAEMGDGNEEGDDDLDDGDDSKAPLKPTRVESLRLPKTPMEGSVGVLGKASPVETPSTGL